VNAKGPPEASAAEAQGSVAAVLTEHVPGHFGFGDDRIGGVADEVDLDYSADAFKGFAANKERGVVAETALVFAGQWAGAWAAD